MRNITVLPEINRVSIGIGKYFSNTNKYDIKEIEKRDYCIVYEILGDTSEIGGKNIIYMLLNGYQEPPKYEIDDLFKELNVPKFETNYNAFRSSVSDTHFTHLFPPIELLTTDEYLRNPFRFKNIRLRYDSSWKIIVDGNLVGKGYMLYQSNDYFDCLKNIENMAGPEFSDSTKYYVVNDYGHYEYFDDVNKAIDLYNNLFSQGKNCLLGALLKFEDYIYYANQEVDLPILKPSSDFREHIYLKKVEEQEFFRANPTLIKGLNIIIQRIVPGQMIDLSVPNSQITSFSRSYLMNLADKEKKVR